MTAFTRLQLSPDRRYRLALFPLALLLRLGNWAGVFTPVGVFPEGTDSYFHLRRILAATARFPFVPDTDRYLNFPEGGHTYWPYGFDIFYAAVVKIVTFGRADEWWTTAIASLVTPVAGAVTACVAFTIGLELGGLPVALLAGGLAAVSRPMVEVSMVGVIDHHVFEALFAALYLLFYLRLLKSGDDHPIRLVVAVGLSLAGGMFGTTVFPVVAALHFGLVWLNVLTVWRESARRRRLTEGMAVWAVFLAALGPFVDFRFMEPAGVNPSLVIGWLIGAVGFAGVTVGALFIEGRTFFDGKSAVTTAIGALAVAGFGFGLDTGGLLTYLGFGNRFVFSSDPVIGTILESVSLWSQGWRGFLDAGSGLIVIFPFGWWLLAKKARERDVVAMTLAAVTFLLGILAVRQLRFCNLAAVSYSVTASYGAVSLARQEAFRKLPRRPFLLGAATVLLVCVWPARAVFLRPLAPTVVTSDGRFINLLPTFQWMAVRTPPTSPAGNAPGDYAVVSRWDLGHWLVAIAGRPCLGSPMTFPWHQRGIHDGAEIFFAQPDRAGALMEKRRARYILVTPIPILETFPLSRWDVAANVVRPLPEAETRETIRRGLYSQLLGRFGVPAGSSSPDGLRHFRLVQESPPEARFPGMDRPFAMLFELVSGASVRGTMTPGATVTVGGVIRTGSGRMFEYADSVTADANGRFEVLLPYASGIQRFSEVEAPEGFVLKSGNASVVIRVTESDVLNGRVRDLGAFPGRSPN